MLPLVMDAKEFGLPLDRLCALLEAESQHLEPRYGPVATGQTGLYNPVTGAVFGTRLAVRMESLLSRPGCRFANAFMWQAGRGACLHAHLDRPPLDVTMSISIVLEGTDRWPLWLEQPDGGRFEWAGTPGTVLIADGRQRRHGRDAFKGTRSVVLLLHWTAPAVLWPGFLDEDARGRMGAEGQRLDPGSATGRRCSDLARLAVPWSMEPEAVVRAAPETAAHEEQGNEEQGAEFLVLLDGKAAMTIDEVGDVALQPGDGIAFPAGKKRRIRWHGRSAGKALVGRSTLSRISTTPSS